MIKIKTTKEVNSSGSMGRLIEDIKLLEKNHLPEKYLGEDCVYLNGSNTAIVYLKSGNLNTLLSKGQFYTEYDFQKIRTILEECGGRLQKINQELKALRESWNGEETFEI